MKFVINLSDFQGLPCPDFLRESGITRIIPAQDRIAFELGLGLSGGKFYIELWPCRLSEEGQTIEFGFHIRDIEDPWNLTLKVLERLIAKMREFTTSEGWFRYIEGTAAQLFHIHLKNIPNFPNWLKLKNVRADIRGLWEIEFDVDSSVTLSSTPEIAEAVFKAAERYFTT